MGWLILVVIVVLVLAVIVIKLKRPDGKADDFPYAKRQVLFTPAERSFLGVLDDAVGKECRIFGKVRVADIAEPQPGLDKSSRQKALNRISSKHFDYVLCDKNDLSIVCVVELDDKSHQQRKRQERDAFLVGLCQAIQLPFVQIPVQHSYSVAETREKIFAALKQCHEPGFNAEPDQASSLVAAPHVMNEYEVRKEPFVSPNVESPTCPKCAAPMVRRQTKTGDNAGKEFWGCSNFPKCRGVVESVG